MPVRAQDAKQAELAARLFEEAQDRLDEDDYEASLALLQQAVGLDRDNQEYASTYGSLLAEVGKADEAEAVLRDAVARFPDAGFEKYMYLGQLLEGEAALQHLSKGLSILEREAAQETDAEAAAGLREQLAGGLCSLAERRLASEAEVDSLAAECEALLARAREADPASPEPLQVLASLRSEQGRPDEALQLLKDSMGRWFARLGSEGSQEGEGSGEEAEAMERDMRTPSFEFRFETAKLLLELDETTDDAIQVLEELLAENDEAVDVYYLLAMCHHAACYHEAALEVLQEGEALQQKLGLPPADPSCEGFAKLREQVQGALAEEQQQGAAPQ